MKNNPLLHSLGHALLVFLYISGVAWLMFNGERIFGSAKSFWIPITILMLFVLSAAIVGALVLGRPILLYLGGAKTAALKFFGYTLGWLFVILLLVLALHPWR